MLAKISVSAAVCAIALALAQTIATTAHSGTSCEDCPSYRGEFSLENNTGTTIKYRVKWGNGQWEPFTLPDGKVMAHWYPLDDNDRAPSPLLKFDRIGGDGHYTEWVVDMDFYKVGTGGYGSGRRSAEKKYFFEYASDDRTILIKSKN
jgi:hypothetical protein